MANVGWGGRRGFTDSDVRNENHSSKSSSSSRSNVKFFTAYDKLPGRDDAAVPTVSFGANSFRSRGGNGVESISLRQLIVTRLLGGQLLLFCVFMLLTLIAGAFVVSSWLNLFNELIPTGRFGASRRDSSMLAADNFSFLLRGQNPSMAWDSEQVDSWDSANIDIGKNGSADRQAAIAAAAAVAAQYSPVFPVARILQPFYRHSKHPLLRRLFSLASSPLNQPWNRPDALIAGVIRTGDPERILLVLQEPHVALGPNCFVRQHLTCLLPAIPRVMDASFCFSTERQPEHPPILLALDQPQLQALSRQWPASVRLTLPLSQVAVGSILHAMYHYLEHAGLPASVKSLSDSSHKQPGMESDPLSFLLARGPAIDFLTAFWTTFEKVATGTIKPTELKGLGASSIKLNPEVFRAFGPSKDRAAADAAEMSLVHESENASANSDPRTYNSTRIGKRNLLVSAAVTRQILDPEVVAGTVAATPAPARRNVNGSSALLPQRTAQTPPYPVSSSGHDRNRSGTTQLPMPVRSGEASSKLTTKPVINYARPMVSITSQEYINMDENDGFTSRQRQVVKAPSAPELWKDAGGAPPLVHLAAAAREDQRAASQQQQKRRRSSSSSSSTEWLLHAFPGWTGKHYRNNYNTSQPAAASSSPPLGEGALDENEALLDVVLPAVASLRPPTSVLEAAPGIPWSSFAIADDDFRVLYHDFRIMATEMLNLLNISWVCSFGTWLGALRHYMVMPWDDDFDILLPHHQLPWLLGFLRKGKLEEADLLHSAARQWWKQFVSDVGNPELAESIADVYAAQLDVYVQSSWQHRSKQFTAKIFLRNAPQVHLFPWKSPFLDIFSYAVTWPSKQDPVSIDLHGYYVSPASEVFPSVYRLVDGLWTPLPNTVYGGRVSSYFSSKGVSPFMECISGYYSHVLEKGQKSHQLQCSRLQPRIPFVTRRIHIRTPRPLLPIFPVAPQVRKAVDELYRERLALDALASGEPSPRLFSIGDRFDDVSDDRPFALEPPPPSLPALYFRAALAANNAARAVASSAQAIKRLRRRRRLFGSGSSSSPIGNGPSIKPASSFGPVTTAAHPHRRAAQGLDNLGRLRRQPAVVIDPLSQFDEILENSLVVDVPKSFPDYSPLRVMTSPDFSWIDGLVEVVTVGPYVVSEVISFSGHTWNLGDLDYATFVGPKK